MNKNINNNIILNSQKNILDLEKKYDFIINKILSKNVYEKNIINNLNSKKQIPYAKKK